MPHPLSKIVQIYMHHPVGVTYLEYFIKFMYSENATKFEEIPAKRQISSNMGAFSENFSVARLKIFIPSGSGLSLVLCFFPHCDLTE